MNKRELNKIFKLIMNEELSTAKDNILRLMESETDKAKMAAIKKLEDQKDTIDVDQTYSLTEKDTDINSLAASTAMSDVQDGNIEFSSPELASDVTDKEVDPNQVNYEFTDLEKDLERLKQKFAELSAKKDVSEDTIEDDLTEPADGDITESVKLRNLLSEDLISSILEDITDDKYRTIYSVSWNRIPEDLFKRLAAMTVGIQVTCNGDETRGYANYEVNSGNEELFKQSVLRSARLFNSEGKVKISKPMELKRSAFESKDYTLEPVKSPENKDGEEAGNGKKISQNDKSPLSDEKGEPDISSATPIVIDTESHSGYKLQTPPAFKTIDVGTVVNRPDIKKVPKDGDPKAYINSKIGLGKDGDKSPIPGKE